MKKEPSINQITEGVIWKQLLLFFFPIVMGTFFQQLYNTADTVIVGRFVGKEALASVGGSTAQIVNLIVGFFVGLASGATVIISQFYGAQDKRNVDRSLHTAFAFSIVGSVFITFLGIATAPWLLRIMNTPENLMADSVLYMRIYFAGMPFFMLYNYGAAILRAVGDTKRPLFFLMIAGVTNALLNMFLVIVLHLGVAGVAIATVIAQMISCMLVLRCLYRSDSSYQFRFSRMGLKWIYLKQIFQVGIPAGIQSTVINFSNVLLQSSVNSFGSVAMAGYTAANNIFGFLFASVNSITQACMSFTSQNYSVGKWKRMDKILRNCILLSVTVSIVMGGGSYLMGPQLLRVYTSDAAVIQCGMEILLYTTVTYFMCGLMDLFPGALRGMGFSAVPMLLSVIGTVGTRIVWIFWVFPKHRSLDVLFISYPASWFLTIVLQVICYCFVRRKLKKAIVTAKI